MRHTKILALSTLLIGMAAECGAQVFQVFQKTGWTEKYDAAQVDSLSYNREDGLTVHLKDGTKETFLQAATDSVVWYDPTNSILSMLRKKGNYTNFLRLVEEDEWWTDMMNGATDLTVFASDDAAWKHFFAENANLPTPNPWHTATSYEALTADQKRALLYSSISESNAGNDYYIRAISKAAGLEALEHLSGSEVPMTYSPNEKWYWERFHESNGGNGIWLATDSSFRCTSFFTPEKIWYPSITEQDYAILFPGATNKIANGIDIVQHDTATNGIIHSVVTPLLPLKSMAEVIRTNGKTDIFSHILDRFSAPFYSPALTEAYKALHPEFTDSIFTKRYFSDNNFSVKAGYIRYSYSSSDIPKFEPGPGGTYWPYNPYKDNYNPGRIPALKYDPGWAYYYDEVDVRKDMAAMFVPSDEAMWDFFTKSAGQSFLKNYYAKEGTQNQIPYTRATTKEELFRQIDCIPIDVLDKLINNLMQRSFIGSVPSKWGKLTNDVMEPLFDNVNDALTELDTCLLANNGMVYVMDKFFLPADYSTVIAPAYINNTCKIIQSAIYGDFMSLNYYAYLKAPQQDITFFLPTDSAMAYYYDPISMKSYTPRVISFYYRSGQTIPVLARL